MRPAAWTSACCVAVLIGGCPKRQSGPRLVYVAPPPPATSTPPAPDSGTWVIEEPAPPEPEAAQPTIEAPPTAAMPKSPPRNRKTSPPPEPASAEPLTGESPALDVPALEPPNIPGQARLREQTEAMQRDVSLRLAQFHRQPLSEAEVRTLAEAKAFLEQSRRALREGDLLRSYNLAHKASLLITAFEQRH